MTEFITVSGYNINIYYMNCIPNYKQPVRAISFLGNQIWLTWYPPFNPYGNCEYTELQDKIQPRFKI